MQRCFSALIRWAPARPPPPGTGAGAGAGAATVSCRVVSRHSRLLLPLGPLFPPVPFGALSPLDLAFLRGSQRVCVCAGMQRFTQVLGIIRRTGTFPLLCTGRHMHTYSIQSTGCLACASDEHTSVCNVCPPVNAGWLAGRPAGNVAIWAIWQRNVSRELVCLPASSQCVCVRVLRAARNLPGTCTPCFQTARLDVWVPGAAAQNANV